MVAGQKEQTSIPAGQREARLLAAVRGVRADLRLPALYQRVAAAAMSLADAATAAVFIAGADGLRCVAVQGAYQPAGSADARPPLAEQVSFVQRMRATQQPVLIQDVRHEPEWELLLRARPDAQAIVTWLAIPLHAEGRFLGFVDCGFTQRGATDEAQFLLREFATDATHVLRHALLLAENATQAAYGRARQEIRVALGHDADHALDLAAAAAAIAEVCAVPYCAVRLDRSATDAGAWTWYRGDGARLDRHVEQLLLPAIAAAGRRRAPFAVHDLGAQEQMPEEVRATRESLLARDIHALIVAPLLRGDEPLGALVLLQDEPRIWQAGEVVLACDIAEDLAAAIRQDRERQRRERRVSTLEREVARLQAAIDHLPLGVVIANAPDEPLFWNRVAATLAANRGSLDGEQPPVFEMLREDGEPIPPEHSPLQRAFAEGQAQTEAVTLRRRDGTLAPVTVLAVPLHAAEGPVGDLVAVLQDTTAQKRMEERAHRDESQRNLVAAALALLSDEVPGADLPVRLGDALRELLPFDWLTVVAVDGEYSGADDDGGRPARRLTALGGADQRQAPPSTALGDDVLARRAVASGSVELVRDSEQDRILGEDDATREAALRSWLVVPISAGDYRPGALCLMSRRAGAFGEQHLPLARSLASSIGIALRREMVVQAARDGAIREERERLAREIHDTLAQTITSMVMQLDLVATGTPGDSPQRAKLEQARAMAREALAETRRTVWNMRPQNMNLQEPRTVLQEEVAVFERRMNLKPEVITSGEVRQVTPEVGAVLQRLLHVALENTWAHSEAQHVRILMDYGLQNLTILIEDDGRGFDPDTIDLTGEGRVGLAGVAERIRSIGGTLRVESAADQGTRVQAELPYAPEPAAPAPIPVAAEIAPPAKVVSTSDTKIRVLLIDDHAMVREGLERMMQDQPDLQVIAAAATGTEGLRHIADLQPDVVLCDLQLPDMSGVEVISKVRTHFPDVRCLVVTTYDDDESIYEGFKAGAKGYVLKDVSATELAEAVRAASRGESLLQPIVARKLVEGFGELARQGGIVETLTEREIEVLRALAGGARNKEIAFSLGLSESTIKTHLASIFGKLNVTTRTEAVAKGRDLGLISL